MIHKKIFTLFMLMGIALFVACNPAQISPTTQANMPNPASVYCEQQGNKLAIVTAADGSQSGVCVFPDGSICDEWAYYRGECGSTGQSGSPSESTNIPAATQEIEPQTTSSIPPSGNGMDTTPAQVVSNGPLRYCFAYPQGFTLQVNDGQVVVMSPHSGVVGSFALGLVWIDATDAQGRSAQEIADEEVKTFGGSPPRWTVMLGGEEALVLDGMPGQDPVRKVYIVHNDLLYTLNFSPYQSEDETILAQMEALFSSVTSSWVWTESGKDCSMPPSGNGMDTTPAQVVSNGPLRYCFAYPQGFSLQVNDGQVVVMSPHSGGVGSLVLTGLVWIDATDAQGRSAQEIADDEVKSFGGSPPRWTVMLGGEEALVLDGMPGQDLIRKVYIVHNDLLYTLNFSPYQSEDETILAQMEALFASVTSSWVWTESGKDCSTTN